MKLTTLALALALGTTTAVAAEKPKPFLWENATVYFLLTDRFSNAFTGNDLAYDRRADAAPLRGYMGGDLAGVINKINEGYFDSLGVNAIWITPPVEQIHDGTDEGTGRRTASTATGLPTSPPSTPTSAPRTISATWWMRRTRAASACCWMW
jgi:alpha-amylase